MYVATLLLRTLILIGRLYLSDIISVMRGQERDWIISTAGELCLNITSGSIKTLQSDKKSNLIYLSGQDISDPLPLGWIRDAAHSWSGWCQSAETWPLSASTHSTW